MDEDYLLALKLQEEEFGSSSQNGADPDLFVTGSSVFPSNSSDQKRSESEKCQKVNIYNSKEAEDMSLIDQRWELMDPNPDIHALFLQFNDRFFNGRLAGVEVRWSPRMTLCAGLCCYEGRAGYCSVRLSQPLLKLRPRSDLIETLLHEMIHAYLFVTANNRDHDAHGPEFHKHMYRINKEAGTNISVYHNFHDEVDHHRQHWWRCDGVCRSKPPYFGYVKRSMNRAPHPRDTWWNDHQRTCGGTYTKVKEPENYKKKGKQDSEGSSKLKDKSNKEKKGAAKDIRSFFGGETNKSQKLNGGGKKEQNGENPFKKEISAHGVLSVKRDDSENYVEKKPNVPKINTINSVPVSPGSSQGKSVSPEKFPGQGFSLGWNGQTSNKIVRKIPGIGIIESERPCLDSRKRKLDDVFGSDSDSDTDEILAGLRVNLKRNNSGVFSQTKS